MSDCFRTIEDILSQEGQLQADVTDFIRYVSFINITGRKGGVWLVTNTFSVPGNKNNHGL